MDLLQIPKEKFSAEWLMEVIGLDKNCSSDYSLDNSATGKFNALSETLVCIAETNCSNDCIAVIKNNKEKLQLLLDELRADDEIYCHFRSVSGMIYWFLLTVAEWYWEDTAPNSVNHEVASFMRYMISGEDISDILELLAVMYVVKYLSNVVDTKDETKIPSLTDYAINWKHPFDLDKPLFQVFLCASPLTDVALNYGHVSMKYLNLRALNDKLVKEMAVACSSTLK